MIKKIDLLGLQLDNYTVREALMQVDKYMDSDTLNVIEQISMQMLIDEEQSCELRKAMPLLNLTIIGEKEILQAAGISTMQRIKETEENDFMFEFLRRMERNRKSIFVLGENEKKILSLKSRLQEQFPKLGIVGECATEHCVGNLESVINDLNTLTPDVIVSILSSPMQEQFLQEHREKINASIWYGMGTIELGKRNTCMKNFLRTIVRFGKLKSSIDKYEEKEEKNDADSAL